MDLTPVTSNAIKEDLENKLKDLFPNQPIQLLGKDGVWWIPGFDTTEDCRLSIDEIDDRDEYVFRDLKAYGDKTTLLPCKINDAWYVLKLYSVRGGQTQTASVLLLEPEERLGVGDGDKVTVTVGLGLLAQNIYLEIARSVLRQIPARDTAPVDFLRALFTVLRNNETPIDAEGVQEVLSWEVLSWEG